MQEKRERNMERPRGSVQRRFEERTRRQGRRSRLHPDPGVSVLRCEHAVTALPQSQRPR